jgi:hypothetical protein
MSTKVPQNTVYQEIDIFQLFRSIGNFFNRMNTLIFKSIYFFVRNWILVLAIIILGFGFGWYLDSNKKLFNNQVIVTPNFGSVDYLYSKIDLIEAKIASGDMVFLKNVVGFQHPNRIRKIEIKPVADVYKFIEDKEQNLELIKLMAEVGEIKKVLEDNVTSKNYTFHTISILSKEQFQENDIKPLLNYLNDSPYFKEIQKIGFKNLQQQLVQNDTIINQIDNVLNGFSTTVKNTQKNDKLIYYSENTQLNDIIKTKQYLVNEQGKNRLKLATFDKSIKEISSTLNLNDQKTVSGNFKIVLPLFFLFLFSLIYLFLKFYRSQHLKWTKSQQ